MATSAAIEDVSTAGAVSAPRTGLIERLFGIDLRALAATRIALAAILLVDLAIRASDVRAMYSDDGVMSIAATQAYQYPVIHWSLHFLDGRAPFQSMLMAIAAIFAVLLL